MAGPGVKETQVAEADRGPGVAAGVASPWRRMERPIRLLVWLLIALAVVEIFRQAQFFVVQVFNVALLFVFASIIALLLTPTVDRLERTALLRGRRGLAVLALWVGIIAVLAGAIALITPTLVDQAQQLPVITRRVQSLSSGLQHQLDQHGIAVDLGRLASGSGSLGDSALAVATGTLTAIIDVLLVSVISIYLLIQGRELLAALRNLFPEHTHLFDFTLVAIGTTVGAYVRGQVIMSLLMGTYIGVSMSVLGVHYAVVLGLLAFLLEFLPLVGATISMVLVVAVALLQSPTLAILAGVVGLGGHAIDAYIVGPRVNAHVTRIHPLASMAALLVGAQLGGILGALFAVPLAAVTNIFLGALYRSRRGERPLTTDEAGEIHPDALPRLGEEISDVELDGEIVDDPVPHTVSGS